MKMINVLFYSFVILAVSLGACTPSTPTPPPSAPLQKSVSPSKSAGSPASNTTSASNSTTKRVNLSDNSNAGASLTTSMSSTSNASKAAKSLSSSDNPPKKGTETVKSASLPQTAAPAGALTSIINSSLSNNPSGSAPVYTYNPEGRKDPFMTYLTGAETTKRIKTTIPLMNYSLSDMQLVAVMVIKNHQFLAMVQTPDLKGYVVKPGMEIGMNHGKIHEITDHSISVEEEYTEIGGEKKKRTVILSLHPPEEGQL